MKRLQQLRKLAIPDSAWCDAVMRDLTGTFFAKMLRPLNGLKLSLIEDISRH